MDCDTGPFVVGQFYRRPVAKMNCHVPNRPVYFDALLPILHTHVGDQTGTEHHHLDMRFMSNYLLRRLGLSPDTVVGAAPVPIEIARVRCFRAYIPTVKHMHLDSADSFVNLQKQESGKVMTCNKCPHQGCDLSSVLPNKVNGQFVLTCPCHGLQWSTDTGRLVPRATLSLKIRERKK